MSHNNATSDFTDTLSQCIQDKDVHKLVETLQQHPNLHSEDKPAIEALLSKSKKEPTTKVLKKFYQKGIKEAQDLYKDKYKNTKRIATQKNIEPIASTSDGTVEAIGFANFKTTDSQNIPITLPTNNTVRNEEDFISSLEEEILKKSSDKVPEFDEETIYEEINVENLKEKDVVNDTVHSVEETTKEIKKGVQHANVAIENSFSDLQNLIDQMSRKTTMTMENMQKQMDQLQKAVLAAQDEIKRNNEMINSNVNQLVHNTDELRSNVSQSDEFNEYVYYLVFTLVSRAIGNKKGRWLNLFVHLLEGYPENFIRKVTWEIQTKHPSEVDMTYDCLTRWKVYNGSSKERLPMLTKALTKMGFNYLVTKINEMLKDYNDEINREISETLSNDLLTKMSKEIGSEYVTVATYLQISPSRLSELDEEYVNSSTARNYAVLSEWREKQQGFSSTSLAKLTGALNYSDRHDLVEVLAKEVQQQMSLSAVDDVDDMKDDYLTPKSLNHKQYGLATKI